MTGHDTTEHSAAGMRHATWSDTACKVFINETMLEAACAGQLGDACYP